MYNYNVSNNTGKLLSCHGSWTPACLQHREMLPKSMELTLNAILHQFQTPKASLHLERLSLLQMAIIKELTGDTTQYTVIHLSMALLICLHLWTCRIPLKCTPLKGLLGLHIQEHWYVTCFKLTICR